jgi:anti-anti-sigma regulatory factor
VKPLSVDVRTEGGQHARVTVTGDVTPDSAYAMHRALEAAASMYSHIVLDLSGASHIDPCVAAELVVLAEYLRLRDGDLVVVGADPA